MKVLLLATVASLFLGNAFAADTYNCKLEAFDSAIEDAVTLSNVQVIKGAIGATLPKLGQEVRLAIYDTSVANIREVLVHISDDSLRGPDQLVGGLSSSFTATQKKISVSGYVKETAYKLNCTKN